MRASQRCRPSQLQNGNLQSQKIKGTWVCICGPPGPILCSQGCHFLVRLYESTNPC